MRSYYNIRWLHFRVGDHVARADDPRHIGRIEAIESSIYVRVRWLDTGWHSIEHANELTTHRGYDRQ